MDIKELAIFGALEIIPNKHVDSRGEFVEWYRFDELEARLGYSFTLKQANLSLSSRGVFRGIHFADVPPGQAKYVTVPQGKVIDFVVDIRVGSPTFGEWVALELSSTRRNAIFIAAGLGHAFISLEDDTVVSYLVSETYNPHAERSINPLDETISLSFPVAMEELIFSDKDKAALSLAQHLEQNTLPSFETCQNMYQSLSRGNK